jgi:HK97 family phage portal protein
MGLFRTLKDRFTTRSLENPSVSLNDPRIFDLLGVRDTASGVKVTPENALEVSAVWAAVRRISSTIASLPLIVYRDTETGRERARSHPNWRLLHDRANPEMSAFQWRELLSAHLLLHGTHYSEIERNGKGDAVALWPIHPSLVTVERNNGRKRFVVRIDGAEIPLTSDAILHVPGFGLDGLNGLRPISLAKDTIGLAKATEEFGSRFFRNGAAPSGILTHSGTLTKDTADKLKATWNNAQTGLSNAQRVAVLDAALKFEPLGIAPEHAQFLETRQFSVSEISRVFLIPPHLINDLTRATFSNIEHQSIEYVQHCIEPWCKRIESVINWDLFGDASPFFAEFNLEGLLRGDSAARSAFYSSALNSGWMSVNEVRERENLPRVPDGDTLRAPLNTAPIDQPPTDAVRSLIDAEIARYQRRREKQKDITAEWTQRQRTILHDNLSDALRAIGENPETYIDEVLNDDRT